MARKRAESSLKPQRTEFAPRLSPHSRGAFSLTAPVLSARPPDAGKDALDGDAQTETPMQHFHAGNLDKIKDAPPNTWATVHRRDVVTLSELARRGFHLVDMSGEVWTTLRTASFVGDLHSNGVV